MICSNPEDIVLESIYALKYAILNNKVKNPSGFLVKAIKYRWKAPDNALKERMTTTQQESECEFPEGFEEWFLEAIDNGFIINESPFTLPKIIDGFLLVILNLPTSSDKPYTQISWVEAKNIMNSDS